MALLTFAVITAGCAPSFDSSQERPNPIRVSTTAPGANPSPSPAPNDGVVAGGDTGSYKRPFGPGAPWNVPASKLARHAESDVYAALFWNHGSREGEEDPTKRGQINLSFDTWSTPIYDVRDATTTKRVFTAYYGYTGTVKDGGRIPWNPSWQPSPGADAEMLIVDWEQGLEWDLWLVQPNNPSGCFSFFSGFNMDYDLCVGRASLVTGPDDKPANINTYEGAFPSKGSGLQNLALMVTAEEVAAGKIDHAIGMDVYNTMFGDPCAANIAERPSAAVSCAHYLSPATRVEWTTGPAPGCRVPQANTAQRRAKTLPEGMRFVLDITDAEIDSWLDQAGHHGAIRSTARIFAVALRDYGFIISDTSCYGATVPTDGITNPKAAELWRSMGVTGDSESSILDGLLSEDRLTVLEGAAPIPTGRSRAIAPDAII